MPNFNQLTDEINSTPNAFDTVRNRYLAKLHEKTGRNVIAYYSAWLQRPSGTSGVSVDDSDKNSFMATVHQMDKKKGLDLILHTPGGDIAATESLVDYLRAMFPDNLRAIVPQLAMSAGTMISCACDQIIMGKQSSLGPIDPQFGELSAFAVIEEFTTARDDITSTPHLAALWQPILSKYPPTFVIECANAMEWSASMVRTWLETGMFRDDTNAEEKAKEVVNYLSDHSETGTHSRHIPISKATELGLKVIAMEDDDELQDIILSVHHAFVQTMASTPTLKIVSNHMGISSVSNPVF